MLDFGATRVELGVQTLDDDIYRLVKRGHAVDDVVRATRLLRENAFKVHYHWMPGLPGSSPDNDLEMSRRLFDDDRFKPDGLKIYPTMVVEGTEIEKWYRKGRYEPYPDEVMTDLVADIKAFVPGYVRISRVLRDIPSNYIVGGLKDSLRDIVRQKMKEQGRECRCIRCREYGHRVRNGRETGEPELVRMDYEASVGREIFLSFEDGNETLFGLLRMRIQNGFLPGQEHDTGENNALIRELHIYGPEVPLKQQSPAAAQHRGLGRALLAEAERIARDEFQSPEISILSGVGAREYYRQESGYALRAGYMVKNL
jgi:elongator complex protein 3